MTRNELRKAQGANNPRGLKIEELRNKGLPWKEVAEQVGTTPKAAMWYLRRLKIYRDLWTRKGIEYYDPSTGD